jgi:hypothetical protein
MKIFQLVKFSYTYTAQIIHTHTYTHMHTQTMHIYTHHTHTCTYTYTHTSIYKKTHIQNSHTHAHTAHLHTHGPHRPTHTHTTAARGRWRDGRRRLRHGRGCGTYGQRRGQGYATRRGLGMLGEAARLETTARDQRERARTPATALEAA